MCDILLEVYIIYSYEIQCISIRGDAIVSFLSFCFVGGEGGTDFVMLLFLTIPVINHRIEIKFK